MTDVVRTPDELILVFKGHQYADLWLTSISGNKIVANGKSYESTLDEGMKGFEDVYYWSPASGDYIMTEHFPAIPDDVESVDLYDIKEMMEETRLRMEQYDSKQL